MIFKKNLVNCSKCGEKVPAESKYCTKWGEPTDRTESVQRQSFVGQIKKCPNCGAIIDSYTAKCPDCGVELSNIENSKSNIRVFSERIVQYDKNIALQKSGGWETWGNAKRIGWIILNIYTICIPLLIYSSKKKNSLRGIVEAEKKSFIQNYTFPNDRQSILDALIFVKDKLFAITMDGASASNFEWAKIWRNKVEQLYQQAEILFPGDSIAKDAYQSSINYFGQIEETKRKQTTRIVLIVICIIVASFVLRAFQ